jgi:hypothetical protein
MMRFFAAPPQVSPSGGAAKKRGSLLGEPRSFVYREYTNITGSPARGKNDDDDGCVPGCSWTQI